MLSTTTSAPLPEDIAALARSLKIGDIAQIQEAMGIKDKTHAVNAHLEKLRDELAGSEDVAQLPGRQRTFLKAITEMMLAKEELDRRGKRYGLADRWLEIILGQKLLQQRDFTVEERGKMLAEDQELDLPLQKDKATAEDPAQPAEERCLHRYPFGERHIAGGVGADDTDIQDKI
jgi:hypothetical protein